MFREVIPVKRTVRDGGVVLLIVSAVAAFFAIRHGMEIGEPLIALSWIPLSIPFILGFFLASARVTSDIEGEQLRVQLAPFSSRQIPFGDIVSIDDVPEVALSDRWTGSREERARVIAPPFDRGPGLRVTTSGRETYRIRTNRGPDVRRAIESASAR